ncbi:MAG: hypothetical protein Q7U66_08090 [Methylobacter sp.]|nr:hypothetical protein [Methylobacter sp.]
MQSYINVGRSASYTAFPRSAWERGHRYQGWYRHFGVWSLLLSWLPVSGDALTFIAGIMKVPLWIFLILVGVGKGLRYAVIILLSGQVL